VLDHVALEVADLARAARFYDALMHPLGGRRIVDSPDGIGYGRDRPELWIMPRRGPGAAPAADGAAEQPAAGRPAAGPPAAGPAPGQSAAGRPAAEQPAAVRPAASRPTAAQPTSAHPQPGRGHVAISASGRRAVDAAHEAGLAAGGRDGGAPAPRRFGPPNYYSGYLVDPDGAWLELVSGSR
jgi:catechol 2,3-dioxygenase-like lactoylglutathione lyase family enzyme